MHTAWIQQPYSIHTTSIQHGYSMHTTTIQQPYSMHTTTIQHPYNIHTARIQHAYSMHTTTIQHGYSMDTACIQHIVTCKNPNIQRVGCSPMLMIHRATRRHAADASSCFMGRLRVRRAPHTRKSKNQTRRDTNSGTDSVRKTGMGRVHWMKGRGSSMKRLQEVPSKVWGKFQVQRLTDKY